MILLHLRGDYNQSGGSKAASLNKKVFLELCHAGVNACNVGLG